ncbi:hypothetical protein GCM10025777_55320 [Membranihabitans marinus]
MFNVNGQSQTEKVLLAGAAQTIITPPIGYSINGGMRDRATTNVHDETHAKGIVIDNGENQLAFVISDLCMVYRETLDKAKKRAHELTGIPVENMMMSATHTHSSGTACNVFQSTPDPAYLEFLSIKIGDAVARAYENRVPAMIGWGFGSEPTQVFNRRWMLKEGYTNTNPFGGQDKVQMNPGVNNPNKTVPSGPVDPEVSVVSIKSLDGDQIALLANYSLHYVGNTGAGMISADYYGAFAERMTQLLDVDDQDIPFVGIMSNGTSGNINNVDYSGKAYKKTGGAYSQINFVANTVAAEVYKVMQFIDYQDWISLDSEQDEISLGVRRPEPHEIERAKKILAKAEGPVLKSREEIYANETMAMKDYPAQVPLIMQAFRLGDLAIAAIPCEVFVEIGLQLKEENPFEDMFTISLANGYNGYLPTPEQHALGGYETWRAKSSYLEVNASVKITDKIMELLKRLD